MTVTLPSPAPRGEAGRTMREVVAEVGAASVPKAAVRDGGDVVRLVDHPEGGICAILADGQGHGRAARAIAAMVTGRIASLMAEGARAEAAISAANDLLLAHRAGQVSCEVSVIAIDPVDAVVRVTRLARAGAVVVGATEGADIAGEAPPLGLYRGATPVVDTVPIAPGLGVLVASDGVREAGTRTGRRIDLPGTFADAASRGADAAAHDVLAGAIAADDGRPRDDMSVASVTFGRAHGGAAVRRLAARWTFA